MSQKQKRELVGQIGWIFAQAQARVSMMFDTPVTVHAICHASTCLDDFMAVMGEYQMFLSVPQAVRSTSGFAMDTGEIGKELPELAAQAEACEFDPSQSDGGVIEELAEGDIDRLMPSILPTPEQLLQDIAFKQSQAAQAPVFSFPKGMKAQDIEQVCHDIDQLITCYRLSWETGVHNQDPDLEGTDDYTDDDRLGFYGFLQWVSNVVATVRDQAQNKTPHIDADAVPKAGQGKFTPPGCTLN